MSKELAIKPNAVQSLASRLQVDPETLKATLKATAFKECKNDHDFMAAVIVSNTYELNPLLKEIYAFPGKSGGVVPVVSIDGWISIVHKQTNYDGVELVENKDDKGAVLSVTATFYDKNNSHPTVVTEYMAECRDASKMPWQKWPIRMLRHKAYIQGARVAFGLSGIYDPDEAERIVESEPSIIKTMKPATEAPKPLGKENAIEEASVVNERPFDDAAEGGVAGDCLDLTPIEELENMQFGDSLPSAIQKVDAVFEKTMKNGKPKTGYQVGHIIISKFGPVKEHLGLGDIVEFSNVAVKEFPEGKKYYQCSDILILAKANAAKV